MIHLRLSNASICQLGAKELKWLQVMINLTDEEFSFLLEEGIQKIPEKFRSLLKNVAIVWADEPNAAQLQKTNLKPQQALFGLYEGIPQTARGVGYAGVLPDKITIFKKAILESCSTLDQTREQVAETIWHELAHHFGSSEQRVRKAQTKRRQRT